MALLRNTRITAYSGRITHHDGIGWHVARHYSAGADHGPFADGEPGQNGRVGPNRGALPDPQRGSLSWCFLLRGEGSFVNVAFGPMKTSSSTSIPSQS